MKIYKLFVKNGGVLKMIKLKLFTDGGSFKKDGGKFDSVSSIRLFKDDELLYEDVEIHVDRTNNYAEIYSIAKGLENVQSYLEEAKSKKFSIEVFTDSQLCEKSLNIWIYSWIRKAKNKVLYNSQQQPVANQDIILRAFKVKTKYYKNIKIYHINSHVADKAERLKNLYKKFIKYNNCEMFYDDFLFAYYQNRECDKVIKPAYDEFIKNNFDGNNSLDL